MNIQSILLRGTSLLKEAEIEAASGDARRLMAFALGIAPSRLTLHMNDDIDRTNETAFMALINKRIERVPVSHLLGGREFFGRWFMVSSDVLDPRPETETLIEAALKLQFSNVLDLGTGSGAIALTLAAEREMAHVVATDLSAAALLIAQKNAEHLDVANRVQFIQSDWFAAVEGKFDLIVSNPPYIALNEMSGLSPELKYEPRMALTDEGDGLASYLAICEQAGTHLRSGGKLLLEIGWQQAAMVTELCVAAGFAEVKTLQDLDGRDRVITGSWR